MKTAIFLAALSFVVSPASAREIDPMCLPDALPNATDPLSALSRVFVRVENPATNPDSAPMSATEVVVARIGADGKPVLACFDDEKAARAFLQRERRRLRTAAEEK